MAIFSPNPRRLRGQILRPARVRIRQQSVPTVIPEKDPRGPMTPRPRWTPPNHYDPRLKDPQGPQTPRVFTGQSAPSQEQSILPERDPAKVRARGPGWDQAVQYEGDVDPNLQNEVVRAGGLIWGYNPETGRWENTYQRAGAYGSEPTPGRRPIPPIPGMPRQDQPILTGPGGQRGNPDRRGVPGQMGIEPWLRPGYEGPGASQRLGESTETQYGVGQDITKREWADPWMGWFADTPQGAAYLKWAQANGVSLQDIRSALQGAQGGYVPPELQAALQAGHIKPTPGAYTERALPGWDQFGQAGYPGAGLGIERGAAGAGSFSDYSPQLQGIMKATQGRSWGMTPEEYASWSGGAQAAGASQGVAGANPAATYQVTPYSGAAAQQAAVATPYASAGSGVDAQAQSLASQLAQQSGVPLTGAYEAGQRTLEDALASQLASLGVAQDQIPAMVELYKQRYATNQAQDVRSANESLAGRGVFDSGLTGQTYGLIGTDYDRQRQDLATSAASEYSSLASQQAEAWQDYQQGLMDLLLQIAASQAESGSMTLPAAASGSTSTTRKRKTTKAKRKRST